MKTLLPCQYVARATMKIGENIMILAMMQVALNWVTPSPIYK